MKGYSLLQIAGFHDAPNSSAPTGLHAVAEAQYNTSMNQPLGYALWLAQLSDKYFGPAGTDSASSRPWVDVATDTLASSTPANAMSWTNMMRQQVLIDDRSDNAQARDSYLTEVQAALTGTSSQTIIGSTTLPTPTSLAEYVPPQTVPAPVQAGMTIGPGMIAIGLIAAYFLFFKKGK